MKIIPAIDLMQGKVVRLVKGDPKNKTIYFDNPLEVAQNWESDGADMLHIVDLDATLGLGSNLQIIEEICNQISIPVQVAGGLRDESIILKAMKFANRIVLGTIAFQNEDLLKKILNENSNDKIVISADHVNGKIVVKGWQQKTNIDLIQAIKKFIEMGFSEFLITDVSKDGTMEGPDLTFLSKACELNANVIASGGVSNIDDIKKIKNTKAFGAILGKALYEKTISIGEAKKIL